MVSTRVCAMSSSRSAIERVRGGLRALRAADLDPVPVRELGAEVLELTRLMATLEAVTAAAGGGVSWAV